MLRVLSMCQEAVVASLVLFPLFLLLGKYYFFSKKKTLFGILFALYLTAVYAVVGLPDITYVRFDPHFNLIPFAYMFSDYVNSCLNVLLFLPLGFFLPLLQNKYRHVLRTMCFGFSTSLLIEFLQVFTYRATDINDLITNTLGTLLGWCFGRIVLHQFPDFSSKWRERDIFLICGISFAVMFFVQPYLSDLFSM